MPVVARAALAATIKRLDFMVSICALDLCEEFLEEEGEEGGSEGGNTEDI